MRLGTTATIWFVFLVATTALGGHQAASPSVDVFAPPRDLSFTISIDRSSYSASGATIRVAYRLENVSNAAILVPREFKDTGCTDPEHRPHLEAWLEDARGQSSRMGYGGSCGSTPGAPPPTTAEVLSKLATRLESRGRADGVLQIELPLHAVTAGQYHLVATLSGWKDKTFPSADLSNLGARILHGDLKAVKNVTLTF
jgi:hypothetical protein